MARDAELEQRLEKTRLELEQSRAECGRLAQIRDDVEAEVRELTASLFQVHTPTKRRLAKTTNGACALVVAMTILLLLLFFSRFFHFKMRKTRETHSQFYLRSSRVWLVVAVVCVPHTHADKNLGNFFSFQFTPSLPFVNKLNVDTQLIRPTSLIHYIPTVWVCVCVNSSVQCSLGCF